MLYDKTLTLAGTCRGLLLFRISNLIFCSRSLDKVWPGGSLTNSTTRSSAPPSIFCPTATASTGESADTKHVARTSYISDDPKRTPPGFLEVNQHPRVSCHVWENVHSTPSERPSIIIPPPFPDFDRVMMM